ncbi:coilin isoform X2 [Solanum dulcamara]|uniref:coilin isoform X2 n=1 Tax=Solanum dulcamara TaxID=45834 RepID=UPI0024856928|nr:coilin isoform X2 [Solanum dulcamara]
MDGVRLRLSFKDPDILSDLQKSEGFKRTWLLLKPQQHRTVSDLSSYLLHTFQLHDSCPNGILLSMDGFVLPPFESTCILEDKDVVSVKKKGGHLAVNGNNGPNAILAVERHNGPNVVENLQIVEKQPLMGGPLLLTNEAFDHGAGGYESSGSGEPEDESEKEEEAEPEEDTSHQKNALVGNAISKKRKASEMLPSSKKKKHCCDVKEKLDEQTEKQEDLTSKKQKVSESNNKDMENNKGNAESNEDSPIASSVKKNGELQKNGVENIEAPPNSDATKKKGPSRSAKRKTAKRRWLREMAKIKEKNTVVESEGLRNWKELQAKAGKGEPSCQPKGRLNDEANGHLKGHQNWKQQKTKTKKEELHWKQFHGEDKNRDTNIEKHAEEKSKSCGQSCQNSDTEDEVVPVEVRPGHIRFEPVGKEQVSKQSQEEVESFRWNGMMSKKKGQKWGQEKVSFSEKNDSLGSNKEYPDKKWNQKKDSFSPKNDSPSSNKGHPEMMNRKRQKWGQENFSFSQKNDSLGSNTEHPDMMNRERQKWSQEKDSFSQKNDSLGSNKEHPEIMDRKRQKWGQENVSFSQKNDSLDSNKEHPEMVNGEKEPHFHESIDFNTLPFLPGLPKEGLVIAYRLLELSSTWTPEVSSYRVGKISWYNSEANRVLLMPVAEFPVISTEDEASKQPDSPIYNEDGSLEIDFQALLEVRLMNSTPDQAGVPGGVIEGSAVNESTPVLGSSKKKTETPTAGGGEVSNGKQIKSTPSENGGVNLWEQFSDTLKSKKAELAQESSWDKASTGKSPWSYRSMRGTALGPTMAFLRSQKKI